MAPFSTIASPEPADSELVRLYKQSADLNVLGQLYGHDLGVGRHHIEYAVAPSGLRIREINNGLHDDESELALDDQLDGNLVAEVVKASLGMPVKPLRLRQVDTQPAAALEAAA